LNEGRFGLHDQYGMDLKGNSRSMNRSDEIYASKRAALTDFSFGSEVARVFPDMVRRSVPGYETLGLMIGCIAGMRARPNSNVYDLGCSLGQSVLMMHSRIDCPGVHYVCVDNSPDMLEGCQVNLDSRISRASYTLIDDDVETVPINNASVVVMNLTLQFVDPAGRNRLIQKIHDGLLASGVLVLSEKVILDNPHQNEVMNILHDEFKRAHGYSKLEISQKRTALERVMKIDTVECHRKRLLNVGFEFVHQWFQGLNFVSFLAIKSGREP